MDPRYKVHFPLPDSGSKDPESPTGIAKTTLHRLLISKLSQFFSTLNVREGVQGHLHLQVHEPLMDVFTDMLPYMTMDAGMYC